MKKLISKDFPFIGKLLNFVNENNIYQNNIQAIIEQEGRIHLIYWSIT